MALLLGPDAAVIRRELGPVAWAVLEALAERAGNGMVTATSVPALARSLRLGRDRTGVAVRRLEQRGLLQRVARRSEGGRFGTIGYRLVVPAAVFTVDGKPGDGRPVNGEHRDSDRNHMSSTSSPSGTRRPTAIEQTTFDLGA